jgi:hypothetical protein
MKWITTIQDCYVDGEDDWFIDLPPEMLGELGWTEGDVLEWSDNNDGSFTVRKVAL